MRVEILRSIETISQYFNNVHWAICAIHDDFVHPPSSRCHPEIETNQNWHPFINISMWLINNINFHKFLKSHMSISLYLCFRVGLCRFIRWDAYWWVRPYSRNITVLWQKESNPKCPCRGEPWFSIHLHVGKFGRISEWFHCPKRYVVMTTT